MYIWTVIGRPYVFALLCPVPRLYVMNFGIYLFFNFYTIKAESLYKRMYAYIRHGICMINEN